MLTLAVGNLQSFNSKNPLRYLFGKIQVDVNERRIRQQSRKSNNERGVQLYRSSNERTNEQTRELGHPNECVKPGEQAVCRRTRH